MKKISVLALTLALTSAVLFGQSISMSNSYESATFFAIYPVQDGKPVEVEPSRITDHEGNPVVMTIYGETSGTNWFGISYVDYTTSRNATAEDDGLDLAATTLVNPIKGPKSNAVFSGIQAREMSTTDKDGDTVIERLALVNNRTRLWQAIVVCSHGTACTQIDADRFFDSIRIK